MKIIDDIEPEIQFSEKEVKELGLKFSDMNKVEYIQNQRNKKIKELAIEWIKNDIKNSTKIIQVGLTGMGTYHILPNGKYCICTATNTCIYHREGKRMMEFLNITEDDLK